MPSLADLVSPEHLQKLATPANRRLGEQIEAEGGVAIAESGPLRISAVVGGTTTSPTRRTTVLTVTGDGIHWSCTCKKRHQLFCKHCVALALVTRKQSPAPQR